jgi:hypothetical protein
MLEVLADPSLLFRDEHHIQNLFHENIFSEINAAIGLQLVKYTAKS